MQTWHKAAVTLLVFLTVVLGSAVLILKSRLAPEAIELVVIPRLEEMLQQPLSCGKITIGLWGTITIRDVSLGDPALHKDSLLFTCPDVAFSCRILPLFSRRIVIDRVAFHQPRINLVRDGQGLFNLRAETPSRPEKEKRVPGDTGDSGATLPELSLVVNHLTIDGGVFTFTAYPKTAARPFKTAFKEVNLTVSDFSLHSPFTAALSLQSDAFPSSLITLKAAVNPLLQQIKPHLAMYSRRDPRCRAEAEGLIALNGEVLTIEQLKVFSGDSQLLLNGTLENCFTGPLAGQVSITSPGLMVDELGPRIASIADRGIQADDEAEEEEEEEKAGELGPFHLEAVTLSAEMVLDRISFRGVHLSDIHASLRVHENTAALESLKGVLGEGLLQMKSRIGLGVRGLTYSAHLEGSNLQLQSLTAVLLPDLKAEVRGSTDLTMVLNGSGTRGDSFKNHLQGEGTINIKDGSLSRLDFLQSLASFIKLDSLGTLAFDRSEGKFKIADGLVHTTNSFRGKEIEFYPEGTISLDSHLNLALTMRVAPSLSNQIVDDVLAKYFKDERGWTVLTLSIKGPADELVVMPASSTIKNISEMLVDILLQKEDSESGARQEKKEALEGLLKKLMKKPPENEPSGISARVPETQ